MPRLIEQLDFKSETINAVGVSSRPRNIDGSYMPCFLVGVNTATAVSKFTNSPLYATSHQVGHILAALYSANKLDLINEKFIAFHYSGGTTEALLVEPNSEEIIKATLIAQSTDLKAGQAIDRTGVLLGLKFPCGAELDKLSHQSNKQFKINTSFNGCDCSLSGVENKVKNMINLGEAPADIAKFVISYIAQVADDMTSKLIDAYGDLPLVYAGGVMSNSMIKDKISNKYNAFFAQPQFSCDNACGTAIYAYLKDTI